MFKLSVNARAEQSLIGGVFALCVALVSLALNLVFYGALFYVAHHFISKYW